MMAWVEEARKGPKRVVGHGDQSLHLPSILSREERKLIFTEYKERGKGSY